MEAERPQKQANGVGSQSSGPKHWGITCDQCGVDPIIGRRLACIGCSNFDLCWSCHETRAFSNTCKQRRSGHSFTEVRRPLKRKQYEELLLLRSVRVKTQRVEGIKQKILRDQKLVADELKVMDKYTRVHEALKKERALLEERLQAVTVDIEKVEMLLESNEADRAELEKEVEVCIETEYEPIREEVEGLRSKLGLPRLSTLQEERERWASEYLHQRRLGWREAGRTAELNALDDIGGSGGDTEEEEEGGGGDGEEERAGVGVGGGGGGATSTTASAVDAAASS